MHFYAFSLLVSDKLSNRYTLCVLIVVTWAQALEVFKTTGLIIYMHFCSWLQISKAEASNYFKFCLRVSLHLKFLPMHEDNHTLVNPGVFSWLILVKMSDAMVKNQAPCWSPPTLFAALQGASYAQL